MLCSERRQAKNITPPPLPPSVSLTHSGWGILAARPKSPTTADRAPESLRRISTFCKNRGRKGQVRRHRVQVRDIDSEVRSETETERLEIGQRHRGQRHRGQRQRTETERSETRDRDKRQRVRSERLGQTSEVRDREVRLGQASDLNTTRGRADRNNRYSWRGGEHSDS